MKFLDLWMFDGLQHELALLRDHVSDEKLKRFDPVRAQEIRIGADGKITGRPGGNKYLEVSIDGGKVRISVNCTKQLHTCSYSAV